jgi:hypothetical protein
MKSGGRWSVFWFLLVVQSCSFFAFEASPGMVIGSWRSDRFDFEGLRLPLAPNIEVSETALVLVAQGRRESLRLESIEADGDTVTVNFRDLPAGLTFHFENRDRMYFAVPLVGTRVYFTKQ